MTVNMAKRNDESDDPQKLNDGLRALIRAYVNAPPKRRKEALAAVIRMRLRQQSEQDQEANRPNRGRCDES
jgi:predicted GTPase